MCNFRLKGWLAYNPSPNSWKYFAKQKTEIYYSHFIILRANFMLAQTCTSYYCLEWNETEVSQSGEVAETLSICRYQAVKYSGHLYCANVLFWIGE